jgi:hypothetical protein
MRSQHCDWEPDHVLRKLLATDSHGSTRIRN